MKETNIRRVYRRIVILWRAMQTLPCSIRLETLRLPGDGDMFQFHLRSHALPDAWATVQVQFATLDAYSSDRAFERKVPQIIEAAGMALQLAEMKGREAESQPQQLLPAFSEN